MRCPNCHNEIDDDSKFCPRCGSKITSMEDLVRQQINLSIKRMRFSYLLNRALNIVSIIAVIFMIIGISGPILNKYDGIGGVAWFSKTGIDLYKAGGLMTGPFFTTMVIYFISLAATIGLGIWIISNSITSLRKREKFKSIIPMMIIIVLYTIYESSIYNFHYEYVGASNAYETRISWGNTVFSLGYTLFIFTYAFYLIGDIVYSKTKAQRVVYILTLLGSYFIFNRSTSIFTSVGFRNYHSGAVYCLGTTHYIDYFYATINQLVTVDVYIINCLELLLFMFSIFPIVYYAYYQQKNMKINTTLLLIIATINIALIIGIYVMSSLFANDVNTMSGMYDMTFYLNYELIAVAFSNVLFLIFMVIAKCYDSKKVKNIEIIDNKQ